MRNQRRTHRLKLGIKYCGGCTPKYDRVALVQELQRALADRWAFVPWSDEDAAHILIVAGCETACVDPEPFANRSVYWISDEAQAPELIEKLRRFAAEPD